MRLIVAITGSSGVIYGIKVLEVLLKLKIETHLIISEWGERNVQIETDRSVESVKSLATIHYNNSNMARSNLQRLI